MKQRAGRISAAERAMAPLTPLSPPPRDLRPPEHLSQGAKQVFADLIATCDEDHFEVSDITVICIYAEAASLFEISSEHIQADIQAGKEPSPRWLSAWSHASKTVSALALRLRIAPQSRRERAVSAGPLDWNEQFRRNQVR